MKTRAFCTFILLSLTLSACRGCDENVTRVKPSLAVSPVALDMGQVKVGAMGTATLNLSSQSRAAVNIQSITFEGNDANVFQVTTTPASISGLGRETLSVLFSPTEFRGYLANLVIQSDDPERPFIRVPVVGEGSSSKIEVTPTCETTRQCRGTVSLSPLEIDFGEEPLVRLLPIPVTALPQVAIVNAGAVELAVSSVGFEGPDAAAFAIAGNVQFPQDGLLLQPGEGVNLALRFVPTSAGKQQYEAILRVRSDDLLQPDISIVLKGTLRPNLPPTVCANITRVGYQDGSAPADFSGPQAWAPFLIVPEGGYDFSAVRDIRPNSEITFSALSNISDETACTSDPEDGRTGLLFQWSILEQPFGSAPLSLGPSNLPQLTLRPKPGSGFATGRYTLQLSVADSVGNTRAVAIRFTIALKEDLVIQLEWPGYDDVDLDLHLVRPAAVVQPSQPFDGVFEPFQSGIASKTSGDINGFSWSSQKNNAGFNFDWGDTGTADDPRLNVDDTGAGSLLELISLNYPENDAACATSACTYKVLVHYFRDARAVTGVDACTVGGSCSDGDRCDCTNSQRQCVANEAPQGSSATGAGKCLDGPKPAIKIFVKGNPVPAAVIPLPTDPQVLSAPCHMLYLANILWPSKSDLTSGMSTAPVVETVGTDAQGVVTQKTVARFGKRQNNSLQCSPNAFAGPIEWYALEDNL